MAEIFGAVAGGAGLVSLAIQLLDSAQKLRNFQHSYQGASARLSQVAFDIETISLALRQIEADRVRHDVSDQELLTRCLQTCQQSTEKITKATEKLERLFAKSKTVAKIATAFKEPALEALFVDLEQAKSALHLAWSLYSSSVARRNAELHTQTMLAMKLVMEQSFDDLSNKLVLAEHSTTTAIKQTALTDTNLVAVNDVGSLTRSQSRSARRRSDRPAFKGRLALPRWITNKVWNLAMNVSEDGWTFTLSTIRAVPCESEIFEACYRGDLKQVQELFACGKASIYDTYWSSTPLSIAIKEGDEHLCNFLLECGKRCDQLDVLVDATALIRCNWSRSYIASVADHLEHEGYEVTANDFDIRSLSLKDGCSTFDKYDSLQQLQRYSVTPLQSWPLPNRIATLYGLEDVNDAEKFTKILGLDTESQLKAACCQYGHELLVIVLVERETSRTRPHWMRFAQRLELLGARVDAEHGVSALHFLLLQMALFDACGTIYKSAEAFHAWIQQLAISGTDLESYGAEQLHKWDSFATYTGHNYLCHSFKLSFTYGGRIEDWSLVPTTTIQVPLYARNITPGAWPEQTLIPQTICWEPYWEGGDWHLVREFVLAPFQSILPAETREHRKPITTVLRGPHDDATLVALLASRRLRVVKPRSRSSSQPPADEFLCRHECSLDVWELVGRAVQPSIHFCLATYKLAHGNGFNSSSKIKYSKDECYNDCTEAHSDIYIRGRLKRMIDHESRKRYIV